MRNNQTPTTHGEGGTSKIKSELREMDRDMLLEARFYGLTFLMALFIGRRNENVGPGSNALPVCGRHGGTGQLRARRTMSRTSRSDTDWPLRSHHFSSQR